MGKAYFSCAHPSLAHTLLFWLRLSDSLRRRGSTIPRSISKLAAIKELLERYTVAAEVVRWTKVIRDEKIPPQN